MSDRHVFSWEDETNSWRSLVCNVLDVIKIWWNLDKHDGSKQQDNLTVSTGSHPWCCGTDILNKVDSHVQNCLNSKCKSCSLCRFGYFVWWRQFGTMFAVILGEVNTRTCSFSRTTGYNMRMLGTVLQVLHSTAADVTTESLGPWSLPQTVFSDLVKSYMTWGGTKVWNVFEVV